MRILWCKMSEQAKVKQSLHFAVIPFNFIIYFVSKINNSHGSTQILQTFIGINL
jgi:hypothetical protein